MDSHNNTSGNAGGVETSCGTGAGNGGRLDLEKLKLKKAVIVSALQEKQQMLQHHQRQQQHQQPQQNAVTDRAAKSEDDPRRVPATMEVVPGPGVVGDQKCGKIYLDDILRQFEAAENAVNLELQLVIQKQRENLDDEEFER